MAPKAVHLYVYGKYEASELYEELYEEHVQDPSFQLLKAAADHLVAEHQSVQDRDVGRDLST